MIRLLRCLTLISLLPVVASCTSTCRGDSCSRPQSSADTMVIWWPEHMRTQPGPSGERSDHQTISLER
ncbi:type III secretion protein [Pseudomonas kairouanensis]|uniref:Type III secretion protein n=1 Tax=Pseudomonas kairouanensis TaxID=2293832 RepID=A0A4Z0AJH4_9PSED|nr:HrpT family type III secretion system protein [Pseudomonas kairouanensis]TFY86936.1 type III secretion protein [Pseudomonas kairouanensis]